nr:hypothetical protein [Tanacetum cinerariifolium]
MLMMVNNTMGVLLEKLLAFLNTGVLREINDEVELRQCVELAMRLGLNENQLKKFKDEPTKQKVRFEPKAYENTLKNRALNGSTSAKDGKNDPTSSSNFPTPNPYSLLSQELDPENYSRSGGEPNSVQVDMERDEEVEVVFDESANLLSGSKTEASTSTYTAPDVLVLPLGVGVIW